MDDLRCDLGWSWIDFLCDFGLDLCVVSCVIWGGFMVVCDFCVDLGSMYRVIWV